MTSREAKIRQGCEAFSRGDFELAASLVHEDFKWIPASHAPGTGFQGRQQFEDWMKPDMFAEQRMEVELVEEHGDKVLVTASFTMRGSGSGLELTNRAYQVWTFRGELPSSCQFFADRQEALAALEAAD